MQYPYQSFEVIFSQSSTRNKIVWRPVIEVILLHNQRFISYPVMIDSGADYNIFHSEIAGVLGITLSSGRKRTIYGIGEQSVKGYEHPVSLKIPGLRTVQTAAIFTNQLSVNALPVLGNQGFFDHFVVKFDYKNKIIDVE